MNEVYIILETSYKTVTHTYKSFKSYTLGLSSLMNDCNRHNDGSKFAINNPLKIEYYMADINTPLKKLGEYPPNE